MEELPTSIPTPQREARTVMFADVVEAVRLVQHDEGGTFRRWRQVIERMRVDALQAGGRLVQILGDGALLEFPDPTKAVGVAYRSLDHIRAANSTTPDDLRIHLRIGIGHGEVLFDEENVFGHTVNVASRILNAAEPDDIILTEDAFKGLERAELESEGDRAEDLGLCHLKHIILPTRLYRIRRRNGRNRVPIFAEIGRLRPRVLVLPIRPLDRRVKHNMIGEILTLDVTRLLVRSSEIDVVSKIALSDDHEEKSLRVMGEQANADFIVLGTWRNVEGSIVVDVQIDEIASARTLWFQRLQDDAASLQGATTSVMAQTIATAICLAIADHAIEWTRQSPFVSLDAHTLLTSGVALTYRLSKQDFLRARDLFEALIDRAPRRPTARLYLANWYVLRRVQGLTEDPEADCHEARELVHRSLDANPDCPFALSIAGLVETHLGRNMDGAADHLRAAIGRDPEFALAHTLQGMLLAFCDEGESAVRSTDLALALAPPGSATYYYESLAASARLTAGDYAMAAAYAARSLTSNPKHASSWRVLAAARQLQGDDQGAAAAARRILDIEPGFSLQHYLQRMPSADFKIGRTVVDALRRAGLLD